MGGPVLSSYDNVAVPDIILVDDEFHILNRKLKTFARRDAKKSDWEKVREELRRHIQEFFDEVVDGTTIANYTLYELPCGRLSDRHTLLGTYARSRNLGRKGWDGFMARNSLKSRLVCYWCVKTWLDESKAVDDEMWGSRTEEESQFLHIFGQSGNSYSSELTLNRGHYACHSDRRYDENGGSRCKGSSTTPASGVTSLTINVNKQSAYYRILIKDLPDDEYYDEIHNEITTIVDYNNREDSNKLVLTEKMEYNYEGFIDLEGFSDNRLSKLNHKLSYKSGIFEKSNVLFLEGLCLDETDSLNVKVSYLVENFSGNRVYSFSNSISPVAQGLGLFLVVNSKNHYNEDQLFEHIPAGSITKAIKDKFSWKYCKLYRFRPECFSNFEDTSDQESADDYIFDIFESRSKTTHSVIDLEEWVSNSDLLSDIKRNNPKINMPKIRTTLRSISAYLEPENEDRRGGLVRLRNNQKISSDNRSVLFKLDGFDLKNTYGFIEFFDVKITKPKRVIKLETNNFDSGSIILAIEGEIKNSSELR